MKMLAVLIAALVPIGSAAAQEDVSRVLFPNAVMPAGVVIERHNMTTKPGTREEDIRESLDLTWHNGAGVSRLHYTLDGVLRAIRFTNVVTGEETVLYPEHESGVHSHGAPKLTGPPEVLSYPLTDRRIERAKKRIRKEIRAAARQKRGKRRENENETEAAGVTPLDETAFRFLGPKDNPSRDLGRRRVNGVMATGRIREWVLPPNMQEPPATESLEVWKDALGREVRRVWTTDRNGGKVSEKMTTYEPLGDLPTDHWEVPEGYTIVER